jgi:hypothetical protein
VALSTGLFLSISLTVARYSYLFLRTEIWCYVHIDMRTDIFSVSLKTFSVPKFVRVWRLWIFEFNFVTVMHKPIVSYKRRNKYKRCLKKYTP